MFVTLPFRQFCTEKEEGDDGKRISYIKINKRADKIVSLFSQLPTHTHRDRTISSWSISSYFPLFL